MRNRKLVFTEAGHCNDNAVAVFTELGDIVGGQLSAFCGGLAFSSRSKIRSKPMLDR
jgi:hypothetical protein